MSQKIVHTSYLYECKFNIITYKLTISRNERTVTKSCERIFKCLIKLTNGPCVASSKN